MGSTPRQLPRCRGRVPPSGSRVRSHRYPKGQRLRGNQLPDRPRGEVSDRGFLSPHGLFPTEVQVRQADRAEAVVRGRPSPTTSSPSVRQRARWEATDTAAEPSEHRVSFGQARWTLVPVALHVSSSSARGAWSCTDPERVAESRNLAPTCTRWFILGSVTLNDPSIGDRLLALRRELA